MIQKLDYFGETDLSPRYGKPTVIIRRASLHIFRIVYLIVHFFRASFWSKLTFFVVMVRQKDKDVMINDSLKIVEVWFQKLA